MIIVGGVVLLTGFAYAVMVQFDIPVSKYLNDSLKARLDRVIGVDDKKDGISDRYGDCSRLLYVPAYRQTAGYGSRNFLVVIGIV